MIGLPRAKAAARSLIFPRETVYSFTTSICLSSTWPVNRSMATPATPKPRAKAGAPGNAAHLLTAINVSTQPAGVPVVGRICAGQLTTTLAAEVEVFGGDRYVILARKVAPVGAGGSVVPE
jgi:hypothetical protein